MANELPCHMCNPGSNLAPAALEEVPMLGPRSLSPSLPPSAPPLSVSLREKEGSLQISHTCLKDPADRSPSTQGADVTRCLRTELDVAALSSPWYLETQAHMLKKQAGRSSYLLWLVMATPAPRSPTAVCIRFFLQRKKRLRNLIAR